MSPFLFIELTWEHVSWLVYGVFIGIGALSALAIAKKNISTEFWAPFRAKYVDPFFNRRQKIDDLILLGEELKTQLGEVRAEVKPNGGGSLRDAVGRIEKHMDYSNAKFRHIDETSPDALFETDENANITYANHAMCDLFESPLDELLERRWLSRIPSSDERNRVLAEWSDAAANKCSLDFQHLFAVSGKKRITVRVQATPRLNRSNELRGFFGKIFIVEQ